MTHGGARPGAGRKASTPDTTGVRWRVSESAKAWVKKQAMAQGVSIATIIDRLIDNAICNAVSPMSELGEATNRAAQAMQDVISVMKDLPEDVFKDED